MHAEDLILILTKDFFDKQNGMGSLWYALQVAEVCRKNGAADVKVVIADLTDPKETQKLGEVNCCLKVPCYCILCGCMQ